MAQSYIVTVTNFTYRRTAVNCAILNWTIQTAVSVQTEPLDTKRQVTSNLVLSITVYKKDKIFIVKKKEFNKQLSGLAMGSPISSLVAEMFFLHFEHPVIVHNIDNKSVIFETRYFYDILITYGNITIIFTVLKELTNSTKQRGNTNMYITHILSFEYWSL